MKADAISLANYLATTRPAPGSDFASYMADAIARWPGLYEREIDWALDRAAEMSGRHARRHEEEARACRTELDRRRR